jgi:hypothetical protein
MGLEHELKEAGREVETETKKAARGLDGTQPSDHIKNAGDELKQGLGNLGDDIKDADDRQYPDTEPSNRTM